MFFRLIIYITIIATISTPIATRIIVPITLAKSLYSICFYTKPVSAAWKCAERGL